MNDTYRQPIKEEARRRLLEKAIAALTSDRLKSSLVREEELLVTLDYSTSFLSNHHIQTPWLRKLKELTAQFLELYKAELGTRKPSDLKVLYLCGPEPINDLRLLLAAGCRPENIWGVEKDKAIYEKAVKEPEQMDIYIRIHHGSLSSFFDQVNDRFDLVYFDGCGPLPGGSPNTVVPIMTMFARERLANLSVLVTNFAEYPSEKEDQYSNLIAQYYSPRYNDTPKCLWQAEYDPAIAHHDMQYALGYIRRFTRECYSDFVTRLTVDIGRTIIPYARVGANPEVAKKFFLQGKDLKKYQHNAINLPAPTDFEDHHAWIRELLDSKYVRAAPSAYPLLSFLVRGAENTECEPLLRPLIDITMQGIKVGESIISVALLENAYEGHYKMASPEMLRAIQTGWFDRKGHYFCDIPMPRHIVSLLSGTYGHPYFCNPEASTRINYCAKNTRMYSDAIVLDQCRYVFNLLPTIDLIPSRFRSIAFQLLVRACLDRIGWHDFSSSSRPFRSTALACLGEHKFAMPREFPDRELLN